MITYLKQVTHGKAIRSSKAGKFNMVLMHHMDLPTFPYPSIRNIITYGYILNDFMYVAFGVKDNMYHSVDVLYHCDHDYIGDCNIIRNKGYDRIDCFRVRVKEVEHKRYGTINIMDSSYYGGYKEHLERVAEFEITKGTKKPLT